MTEQISNIDPEGLLEYSVVFTDRSLNHMSKKFQQVMKDLSSMLKQVYSANGVAIVPGGGTFGMEAVARQFAMEEKCLIVRNGWFSFRWSQILEVGNIPSETMVFKACPQDESPQPAYAPAPIEKVTNAILKDKPKVVFAPHVETSSGMILPDNYIKQLATATHSVGGLLILDCIASGAMWVDMAELEIDVLISAPQKGWSSTPCAGIVMLGEKALEEIENKESSSFSCDLKKWLRIMEAYEKGGHAYHATMPTDGLKQLRDTILETKQLGFEKAKLAQQELGTKVRELLARHGYKSLAAEEFEAPGVIVSYTDDSSMQDSSKFAAEGLQIAAGVPLQCDEAPNFKTFRIGLFGLDKLTNINRTVSNLSTVLSNISKT